MKTVGIIAEYNPFHKGHAYQIGEAKKHSGADYCIVVMSGNFLQRGEAACLDKFTRARCALLSGADLVLELSVPFATATAPVFAQNSVLLLQKTGVVTHLSFGCECDNLQGLQFLASFFEEEPKDYQQLLKERLKKGDSYPVARKAAFLTFCENHPDCIPDSVGLSAKCLSDLLDTPNNILALSYLRAIKSIAPEIILIPIKRKGSGYHEDSLGDDFSSAQAIRNTLFTKGPTEKLLSALPEETRSVFTHAWENGAFVSTDAFSSQLYYKLLSLSGKLSTEDFISYNSYRKTSYEKFSEVTNAMANRIEKHLSEFTTFSEFTKLLMRKNETYSTISRGLLHILLDIEKQEFDAPQYFRVLGLKKEASPLLHKIKEKGSLPIITKAADAASLLPPEALSLLEKDFFAENLYHSCFRCPGSKGYHPYLQNPVLL